MVLSTSCCAVIWKGILTEQPSFRRSAWKEVSDEAKDFVNTLLNKVSSCRCERHFHIGLKAIGPQGFCRADSYSWS